MKAIHTSYLPRPGDLVSTKCVWDILKYPSILSVNGLLWAIGHSQGATLETLAAPMIIMTLLVLTLMEYTGSFKSSWHLSLKEWGQSGFYFAQNAVAGPIAKGILLVLLAYSIGSPWENSLPFALQIPLAILIMDFAGFLMHRAYHEISWLWPIHAIHHAPTKVTAFNNNAAHFLNIVLGTLAPLAPVFLLGFSAEAIAISATYSTIHGFIVHANTKMDFGFFASIVMTPDHHRLHHSTLAAEAGNHATIFTFWDRMYGTYVDPMVGTPKQVGLFRGDEVPDTLLGQVIHPFAQLSKYWSRKSNARNISRQLT